jgi:hypothetical protein
MNSIKEFKALDPNILEREAKQPIIWTTQAKI